MDHLPNRKAARLPEYDYSAAGAYFITICTKDRAPILSKIDAVGTGVLDRPHVTLLSRGLVADKYIRQLDDFYAHIFVDAYVIMPNHIHILLRVLDAGRSRTPAPTPSNSIVAQFVSTFKRFSNSEYGENVWQRSFYDHIIRGEQDYQDVWNYIDQNPAQWQEDHFYTD